MNERIRELAEQAELNTTLLFNKEKLEKFAELIVKECMSLMNQEREGYAKPSQYQSREYYERFAAKEDAFDDAAHIIKNHFGVE